MVHQDSAAGGAGDRGGRERLHPHHSRELPPDLSELDDEHPRLVHLAAVVVGTPDSGMVLRVWRNYRCAGDAGEVCKVRWLGTEARPGRSRHVVFFGIVAVYGAGVAGADAGL